MQNPSRCEEIESKGQSPSCDSFPSVLETSQRSGHSPHLAWRRTGSKSRSMKKKGMQVEWRCRAQTLPAWPSLVGEMALPLFCECLIQNLGL
jgi:hypothetical protein